MDISVIVAIYNVDKYLDDCVQSLVNQDFANAEFILVDDGSLDNSPTLCDIWQSRDLRIKVVHKPNGGLSDARNAGLNIAKGDYVMFVDGDDALDAGTLSILFKLAQQNDSDMLQYGYREVSKANLAVCAAFNGRLEYITDRHEMYMRLYELGGIAASGCTKLIKRQVLQNLKFAKGKLHEDEFFTTELLAAVKSVIYIADFTPYQYVKRIGSIITCGFNPKRIHDICEMYELRIMKLKDFGFYDIVVLSQNRFFQSLYIQYHKSRSAKDDQCTKFIKRKIDMLASGCSLDFSLEMRIARVCPRLMLPIFYLFRMAFNKRL